MRRAGQGLLTQWIKPLSRDAFGTAFWILHKAAESKNVCRLHESPAAFEEPAAVEETAAVSEAENRFIRLQCPSPTGSVTNGRTASMEDTSITTLAGSSVSR